MSHVSNFWMSFYFEYYFWCILWHFYFILSCWVIYDVSGAKNVENEPENVSLLCIDTNWHEDEDEEFFIKRRGEAGVSHHALQFRPRPHVHRYFLKTQTEVEVTGCDITSTVRPRWPIRSLQLFCPVPERLHSDRSFIKVTRNTFTCT